MSADSATNLADLRARVGALEDERAVLQTLYRYGHTIDYGHRSGWLDCFVESGVFEVRLRGELKARHEGRAALESFIEGHTAIPEAYHKHLLIEPAISVDGNEARVESYFVRLDDDRHGAPQVHGFGRYVDRLVRGADGRWRFAERVAEIEAFDGEGRPGSWELKDTGHDFPHLPRRVVTGVGPDGRSTVVSSGPPPSVYRFAGPQGRTDPHTLKGTTAATDVGRAGAGEVIVAELWASDGTSRDASADPTVTADGYDVECEPGATRWRVVEMGPHRQSAMHRTATLDYDIVLSGEVDLILEDGEVGLVRGDTVVIPGVVHAWRTNDVSCVLGINMIGLDRADAPRADS